MDVYDRATRSYVMSRIRGRDTRPELVLRKLLWKMGIRGYRVHAKIPGRPDVVFSGKRLAVFVQGCFWHGCRRCAIPTPTTHRAYWSKKIAGNRRRDRRTANALRRTGWKTVVIWEHEIRKNPERCVCRVADGLNRTHDN